MPFYGVTDTNECCSKGGRAISVPAVHTRFLAGWASGSPRSGNWAVKSATMQSIKTFLATAQQVGGRLGVKFSEVVHGVAQNPRHCKDFLLT